MIIHRSDLVVSAQEMRELDSFAISVMGMPSAVLMERAALACVARLGQGDFDLSRVLCLCGTGNNGGDGMAVARLLLLAGYDASVVLVGKTDRLTVDALLQHAIAENYGATIQGYTPGCLSVVKPTTIVDALFGIGLSRPLEGLALEAIEEASCLAGTSDARVLAVDIPSGVSADTGEVCGMALPAHATVTFAFNKAGLVKEPGATLAGDVQIADIGIYDESSRHQ
ncbi:MAG: NAD(P)H-hydrate epimerase [Coriobacteriales bacterium]|nr:NAD(P)H-hydrate epimerase [Coriobacteriales bacterium]